MSEEHNVAVIGTHKLLLQKLNDFCFGNGNKGANVRLDNIEDIINGNKECSAMKDIQKHMDWHDKMSGRRWEVTVGLILVVIGQAVSLYFIAKGG